MVIHSIPPRIKFRPISTRFECSGKFWPISTEIHFLADMNLSSYFPFLNFISIFLARSPKILLILLSISHFHTCSCSSLSLYHLSLSDPLNRDREVEKKIEEQDVAKEV